jgi:hypothetical protein
MGERKYSSTILDLEIKWKWSVSFTPPPLSPRGKSTRYQLDRRLGEPQSRSGRCGVEKKISCPSWETNPTGPARQPSLYQLSYLRKMMKSKTPCNRKLILDARECDKAMERMTGVPFPARNVSIRQACKLWGLITSHPGDTGEYFLQ